MTNAVGANIPELTVSELSAQLKRTIEDAYGYVRVRGEVSGFRGPHTSGHCYFALKDAEAKIDAVIWKGTFNRLRMKPEEGLEVVVTGRITTYPGRSSYQIIIETLEPAGVGALMALIEERRRRLAAEGLFDAARKKPLPYLPTVIGVVTSPTGAVIRDILHRLADRFPRHVVVWPVRVQGPESAAEVAAAIRGFNALPRRHPIARPDLLIVARGGGSLEDLWPFNEEIVVRAAAESAIPLIAAIGHETDVTLIDFAADQRAPTPTAAAEMAVPLRSELVVQVDELARRQHESWLRSLDARRKELRGALRALPSAESLLQVPRQRLDQAGERLPRALRANAQSHHREFVRVAARLAPGILRAQALRFREQVRGLGARAARAVSVMRLRRRERLAVAANRLAAGLRAYRNAQAAGIARNRETLGALLHRAQRAVRMGIERRAAALAGASQLLASLSYHAVLARGFALVRDAAGTPLRSAAAVVPGLRLDIEFADGHIGAVATDDAGRTPQPEARPKGRRSSGDPSQGNLFG